MIEEDIPDIVETLRECAEDSRKVEGDYYADQFATDASVFDEAADEIERLRQVLSQKSDCPVQENGAKQATLTDDDLQAFDFMLRHAAWAAANGAFADSADYRIHHDTVFRIAGRR